MANTLDGKHYVIITIAHAHARYRYRPKRGTHSRSTTTTYPQNPNRPPSNNSRLALFLILEIVVLPAAEGSPFPPAVRC